MAAERIQSIRRAQKESLLFREFSSLFLAIVLDNPELQNLSINRVKLSKDGGSMCQLFFYTPKGESYFKTLLQKLILYKPSLRKAISQRIPSRHTPQLLFKFDHLFEKQQSLEKLLDDVTTKGIQ